MSPLLLTALGTGTVVSAEGRWQDVAPGYQIYEGAFQSSARDASTRIVAVRLNPKKYEIHVVQAGQLRNGPKAKTKLADYGSGTLRDALQAPNMVAGINGGFITSYAFPQPLGLTRIESVNVAPVGKGPLLSGYLCVTSRGAVRIAFISEWPDPQCRDALQAGPLIIEPKERKGIQGYESKRTPFIRSVVCTDDESITLVRSETTTLFDLMNALLQERGALGVGCDVALNLGGDANSGIFWHQGLEVRSEGSLDATLATAIVAIKR